MADVFAELIAKANIDTTEFDKNITKLRSEMEKLGSVVDKSLKNQSESFNGGSKGISSFQKEASKSVNKTSDSFDKAGKSAENFGKKTIESSRKSSEQLSRLALVAAKVFAAFAALETGAKILTGSIQAARGDFEALDQTIRSIPLGIGPVIGSFIDFGKEIQEVFTGAKAKAEEFDRAAARMAQNIRMIIDFNDLTYSLSFSMDEKDILILKKQTAQLENILLTSTENLDVKTRERLKLSIAQNKEEIKQKERVLELNKLIKNAESDLQKAKARIATDEVAIADNRRLEQLKAEQDKIDKFNEEQARLRTIKDEREAKREKQRAAIMDDAIGAQIIKVEKVPFEGRKLSDEKLQELRILRERADLRNLTVKRLEKEKDLLIQIKKESQALNEVTDENNKIIDKKAKSLEKQAEEELKNQQEIKKLRDRFNFQQEMEVIALRSEGENLKADSLEILNRAEELIRDAEGNKTLISLINKRKEFELEQLIKKTEEERLREREKAELLSRLQRESNEKRLSNLRLSVRQKEFRLEGKEQEALILGLRKRADDQLDLATSKEERVLIRKELQLSIDELTNSNVQESSPERSNLRSRFEDTLAKFAVTDKETKIERQRQEQLKRDEERNKFLEKINSSADSVLQFLETKGLSATYSV